MQRIICVLIVLAIPMLVIGAPEDVKKELKVLQGKWQTAAIETGGEALPKEAVPAFSFAIDADGKATGKTPEGEFQFTVTVDPTKTPRTIENLHDSGGQKGMKQYGIYKLDGDKFTVCMTPPGSSEKDRPKDFDTKGTRNVVFVFERVKGDGKP
jgi:uncharacterized protein (TIGR03067 family)